MDQALNILFICNKSPWPPREGGPIAMNNLIEGLLEAGHKVKVLAINSNKYATDPKDVPPEYLERTGLELVYVDLSIKPMDAFLNLFTKKSYHVQRFISSHLKNKLEKILKTQTFDVVQIETLFMSPYLDAIRKHSEAKVFLRAHNIEHMIWQRLADRSGNPLKKWYLNHLTSTLKQYEISILDAYDGILPITQKDGNFFKNHSNTPVHAVSFGIDGRVMVNEQEKDPEHAVFHIGSMNWMPNEEGVKWFLDEVWPLILKESKDIKLYLAGREMPEWMYGLDLPQVEVVGEVENAQQFIQSKTISIAPLLSGSGIRIKIIESMAQGKAVVATRIGAEGINYTHEKNMLFADTAEDFAAAVLQLHRNKTLALSVGKEAQQLIRSQHQTSKIISGLVAFYRKIL